jgi:uncharacterized protein (DUF488 family)
MKIYAIGHSTHPISEFIDILKAHHIEQLVDVRTIAKSRHNPQFGEQSLAASLAEQQLKYLRLEKLGGLRPTTKDSINKAWRNKSFRGYADYMQTSEFTEGLRELIKLAKDSTTAIMCAEAVPWRCHRSLIGDALLLRDIEVIDIMNQKSTKAHALTSFAVVDGLTLTYPETV